MAESSPEGQSPSFTSSSTAKNHSSGRNLFSTESCKTSTIAPESESNGNSANGNGTKRQNEKKKWMVQDQPGVYITLSSLPSGHNELKRVRFSRKYFTEQEAEKWWAENGAKVCERYKIPGAD